MRELDQREPTERLATSAATDLAAVLIALFVNVSAILGALWGLQ